MDQNSRDVLKKIINIIIVLLILYSCSHHDNFLIGKWAVEKVSFEFDERKVTPQMIKQYGEEESRNVLKFKNDTIVYVKMAEYDGDYYYKINNENLIVFGDNLNAVSLMKLGLYKDNVIISEINTVIGKMKIIYKKK